MTDYLGDLARRAADPREEFLPPAAPLHTDPVYESVTEVEAADPLVGGTEQRVAAADHRPPRPAYRPSPEYAPLDPEVVTEEVAPDAPLARGVPAATTEVIPTPTGRPTDPALAPPPFARTPAPREFQSPPPPLSPVVRPAVVVEPDVVSVTEEVRADRPEWPSVRPTPTPAAIEYEVERIVPSGSPVADAPRRQPPSPAVSPSHPAPPVRPAPVTERVPLRSTPEVEVEMASPPPEREIVPRPSLPPPPVRPIGRGVPSVAPPPPPAETVVHVSIGRVEVRAAVGAKKAAAAPAARPPARTLEDYLRGPAAGGAS